MLTIALLDIRRLVRSRATWVLLLLALSIMGVQTAREAYGASFAVNPVGVDVSAFAALVPDAPAPPPPPRDVLARQASPVVRLMTSFDYLQYLALSSIMTFGGFFAQDIRSGYACLRRVRGQSLRRLFVADVLTIVTMASALSAVTVAVLFAVCLAIEPRAVNSLVDGQMILQQVFFLPHVAATQPVLYVLLIVFLYTVVLSFLGLFGRFVASVTGDPLVASLAPAGLMFVFGGLASSHLPWPWWAFDIENLSFTQCFITEPAYVLRYVGGYFVWVAVFLAIGLWGPRLVPRLRGARP